MKGSVRRRSKNSWELTIDLGRDHQGKRLRKFVNVKGKRSDADRRLREVLALLDKGLPVDSSKVTVAELLDRWHEPYVIPSTRPRTAESYEVIIRRHLKPYLGELKLAKLQPIDIQTMEADLLAAGKSARTVKHIHRVFHEALKHAVKWGFLWRNPAESVDVPRPVDHEISVPDASDIHRILTFARETPYFTAFHFMAFTGCRRGECLGLRWKDVDLDRSTASIVHTLQRVKGLGLIFDSPKSKKGKRALDLDGDTVSTLKRHRVGQLEQRLQVGELWEEQGLVFPSPTGTPLDPSVLTHNFSRLTKKAGLSGVRLHDLRHFHATLLLKEGTHPKVVQERLGHATVSIMLDTYSHVIPSLQTEAADAFAAAMGRAVNEE